LRIGGKGCGQKNTSPKRGKWKRRTPGNWGRGDRPGQKKRRGPKGKQDVMRKKREKECGYKGTKPWFGKKGERAASGHQRKQGAFRGLDRSQKKNGWKETTQRKTT